MHSYVLLFPRSFGSFVNTYTQFRPLARQVVKEVVKDERGGGGAHDLLAIYIFYSLLFVGVEGIIFLLLFKERF